ncbi:uncharacterized protein BDR25DRAFT_256055 [Lindgomyces ingoldianus]|uniref:Uncharacterized protein n=1 Tax=Lindgomyces ingoldianus TaxID=673940 RepID=A0ACB6R4N7_9PLEO|nr:uncharacterized protein BDR25DRAFT_256055 [Lindgomyces ingoldianus]KAF2474289.1 hypothetical protein BDR25DRAFT_256055 [Lindgomyces ingoldianus]
MAGLPSIGDILMLSQLAWKIGRAFTAGRKGAPTEFLEVETEINGLAKALKLLAETLFADLDESLLEKADKETQAGVATIVLSCQRTVNDLDSLMDQYQVIKKHRTVGGFAIERTWSDLVLASYKTMMWTTEGGNIQNLRNMLRMHTSSIALTMQAMQSKSLARLESVVAPMAEKIDKIHHRTGSLGEQLEEVRRIAIEIAGDTLPLRPTRDLESPPQGSPLLDRSRQTPLSTETIPTRQYFPPRQSSNNAASFPELSNSEALPSATARKRFSEFSFGGPSGGAKSQSLEIRTYETPVAPSSKRFSELSIEGSSPQFSGSYPPSDAGTHSGWSSPATSRNSFLHHQPSKKESRLPMTPEMTEPTARPDSTIMPPLPPPALDIPPDPGVDKAMSVSKLSLVPSLPPDIIKLHRSSTTSSQRDLFEKAAFRNSAILCDVRGSLVEYAQKVSSEEDSHDVEMIKACQECRIAVVRKRETSEDNSVRMMTSIWVFSDDNIVRLQLKLADGEIYLPYSSYFNPEKISVTVPCELRFHDVRYGTRPLKIAKTHWVNYYFEDTSASTLFQNEIMGRSLLSTFRTEKTLRIHEGLSGAFSYQEQMCGMENLRIWEDETTGAVIAMIHYSAQFRLGYLSFYLNSSRNPIRLKDEGGKEIKIKGLRVPLEKVGVTRKDSGAGVAGEGKVERKEKELDKRKIVSGVRIEFGSEHEKRNFIALVKDVQRTMLELPDLIGV